MRYLDLSGDDTPLYLAVPIEAYTGILAEALTQQLLLNEKVRLIVFDPESEEIVEWNP